MVEQETGDVCIESQVPDHSVGLGLSPAGLCVCVCVCVHVCVCCLKVFEQRME